jgi:hypothetical protein
MSYKTGRELISETLTRSVPSRHASDRLKVVNMTRSGWRHYDKLK